MNLRKRAEGREKRDYYGSRSKTILGIEVCGRKTLNFVRELFSLPLCPCARSSESQKGIEHEKYSLSDHLNGHGCHLEDCSKAGGEEGISILISNPAVRGGAL